MLRPCLHSNKQKVMHSNQKNADVLLLLTVYGMVCSRKIEKKEFSLAAYMNLTRLRSKYLLYNFMGVERAFWVMVPDWKLEVRYSPDIYTNY